MYCAIGRALIAPSARSVKRDAGSGNIRKIGLKFAFVAFSTRQRSSFAAARVCSCGQDDALLRVLGAEAREEAEPAQRPARPR